MRSAPTVSLHAEGAYRAVRQIGRLTPRDMFAECKHDILPQRGSTICLLRKHDMRLMPRDNPPSHPPFTPGGHRKARNLALPVDGTRGKRAIFRWNEAWYARSNARSTSVTKRSVVERSVKREGGSRSETEGLFPMRCEHGLCNARDNPPFHPPLYTRGA